jgi:membrane fusion protein (multidrug efflux system)
VSGFLCLLVLVAVTRILVRRKFYIETENATLQGYAIALSSEVEGEVLQVLVEENQFVQKGQLLCVLEDSRWVARLEDAEAKRDAAHARWENARRDEARANQQFKGAAISPESRDLTRSQSSALWSQLQAFEAQAAQARTQYERTRIYAPRDGVIAFRTARPGMLAQNGTPLFGFVDLKDRWVLARVRETDLTGLHIGKTVEVRFDAVPGRKFNGKIESVSPATEKPFFSAIPADFSAGNFTKYVQWYPIRIRLVLNDTDQRRIPIGISSQIHMSRD